MDQPDVFVHALRVLDEHEIPYAIVGSIASMSYGEYRTTLDMDVVIRIEPSQVEALCADFPDPDWYVSVDAAREAVRRRKQFNAVHLPSGYRIDFMIAEESEWARQQLERRQLIAMEGYPAYTAHPEDIILGKLQYFRDGGSDKHLSDIAKMIETSGHLIDQDNVSRWADELGVRYEWDLVLQRIQSNDASAGEAGPA
jgi:hypothetical protein